MIKKSLIGLTLSMLFVVGACSNDTENKVESEEKESESIEKKDESSEQENNNNIDNTESDKNTDGLNHAKPIEEMTPEEYDTYLLTQKRSYLTKEQQKRYDELLEMKGSTPAENDEKNKAYNNKKRNELEGNGGGTALITPPETEQEKEELRKRQAEQAKQRKAESNDNKQPQQSQQVQQQQKQKTQQQPTQEVQRKEQSPVENSEKEAVVKEVVNDHEKHVTEE
ncbi:hypothetical protein BU098_10695 [Staphylococcus xylosus]|nr:hypothetical protein BU098_10695 [Staphylococcus xylosus]